MQIKFQIKTENMNNPESMDSSSLHKVLTSLETSYKTIRNVSYSYFLGMRSFRFALFCLFIGLIGFYMTQALFFLYFTIISVLATFLISLSVAELSSHIFRKQISKEIAYIKKLYELALIKEGKAS